jgi:hypothetical protein
VVDTAEASMIPARSRLANMRRGLQQSTQLLSTDGCTRCGLVLSVVLWCKLVSTCAVSTDQ